MKFRDQQHRASGAAFSGQRAKLWVLVAALALVVVAIQRTRRPEFAEQLDRVFAPQVAGGDARPAGEATFTLDEPPAPAMAAEAPATESPNASGMAAVRDNTYFRSDESEAWFGLFKQVRDEPAAEPGQGVAYAQLIEQPDAFRGRVVTLEGTVIREESTPAAKNDAGFDRYHRLWIAPRGGGRWPFVVYCLRLPEGFPRGDGLREPVAVSGRFFKNWSYAFDEGMGLAPVVLASGLQWTPLPAPSREVGRASARSWALPAALTCAGSLALVVLLWRRTRRPAAATPESGVDWSAVELRAPDPLAAIEGSPREDGV